MLCRRAALLYCRSRRSHNVVWDTSYLNSLAAHNKQSIVKIAKKVDSDDEFEDHDSDKVAEALEKGTFNKEVKSNFFSQNKCRAEESASFTPEFESEL